MAAELHISLARVEVKIGGCGEAGEKLWAHFFHERIPGGGIYHRRGGGDFARTDEGEIIAQLLEAKIGRILEGRLSV